MTAWWLHLIALLQNTAGGVLLSFLIWWKHLQPGQPAACSHSRLSGQPDTKMTWHQSFLLAGVSGSVVAFYRQWVVKSPWWCDLGLESDDCIVHFGGIYFWVVDLFIVVFVSIGPDLQQLILVASQLWCCFAHYNLVDLCSVHSRHCYDVSWENPAWQPQRFQTGPIDDGNIA